MDSHLAEPTSKTFMSRFENAGNANQFELTLLKQGFMFAVPVSVRRSPRMEVSFPTGSFECQTCYAVAFFKEAPDLSTIKSGVDLREVPVLERRINFVDTDTKEHIGGASFFSSVLAGEEFAQWLTFYDADIAEAEENDGQVSFRLLTAA
jgi:hypothetical protein